MLESLVRCPTSTDMPPKVWILCLVLLAAGWCPKCHFNSLSCVFPIYNYRQKYWSLQKGALRFPCEMWEVVLYLPRQDMVLTTSRNVLWLKITHVPEYGNPCVPKENKCFNLQAMWFVLLYALSIPFLSTQKLQFQIISPNSNTFIARGSGFSFKLSDNRYS